MFDIKEKLNMDKIFSVFVSSTFEDLQTERRLIADVLLNCSCFPRGMELFTAGARKPWAVITDEIQACDFYLLLIGGRYGSYCKDEDVVDRKISFTQREFEYAHSLGKPIIVIAHKNWKTLPQTKKHIDWDLKNDRADHEKQDKLNAFIDTACDNRRRSAARWSDSSDLKYEVQRAVANQTKAMRETAGWIRGGSTSSDTSSKIYFPAIEKIDFRKQLSENKAKKSLFISGATLNVLGHIYTDIDELGIEATIQLLLLNPNNAENLRAFATMYMQSTEEELSREIAGNTYLDKLSKKSNVEVRVIDFVMPMTYTAIDINTSKGYIIARQNLVNTITKHCPHVEVFNGEKLYATYKRQVETLWEFSKPYAGN